MNRIILLVAFISCIYSYASGQKKPRYALVIGNASYEAPATLKNPVNDAELIRKKLEECGFTVFLEKNLSKGLFDEAISRFYSFINKVDCEALFYYSGHGIQNQGRNYLVPLGAKLEFQESVSEECVSLELILSMMNSSRSTANIVIMDACRINPFARSWMRGGPDRGLTAVNTSPKESFIFYATAQNDIANDGTGLNSPFSKAFAKHVTEPGLSINSLLIRIINDVMAQYPKQRPWGSMSIKKDFYFVQPVPGSQAAIQTAVTTVNNDRATIHFLANQKCSISFDGEKSVLDLRKGIFDSIERPIATYRIRAVSPTDTLLLIDTVMNFEEAKDYHVFLDLEKVAEERRTEFEKDPAYIARKKIFEEIKSEMAVMTGGEFLMGNKTGNNDEVPRHPVRLSNYQISRYEVSQKQWRAVMNTEPFGFAHCDECPVENVSWDDAIAFITKLNAYTGENYRLPTEAEWEYAARGGNLSKGYLFSGGPRSDNYGWTAKNAGGKTHTKESRSANEKGIHDMTGNVAEWCSDFYDPKYYNKGIYDNPGGPTGNNLKARVVRGGSWNDNDMNCRNAARFNKPQDFKSPQIGFRLVKSTE